MQTGAGRFRNPAPCSSHLPFFSLLHVEELVTDTVEQWDTRMLFPAPSELADVPADTDLTVEVTFGTLVRSCTAKLVDA